MKHFDKIQGSGIDTELKSFYHTSFFKPKGKNYSTKRNINQPRKFTRNFGQKHIFNFQILMMTRYIFLKLLHSQHFLNKFQFLQIFFTQNNIGIICIYKTCIYIYIYIYIYINFELPLVPKTVLNAYLQVNRAL